MIRFNIRGFWKMLSTVVLLALMTGSAQATADQEPTYRLDGSWLVFATAGAVKRPFMDTYTSSRNQGGLSGTVICTLPQGRVLLPLGPGGALISVTGTQTAQGTWTRVEKNVYAYTNWRILTDPDGRAVGWIKFWGSVRPDAPDHFFGDVTAAFYTLDFVALPIPSPTLPTEGTRVAVEAQ
jgi:hypothetical protein